MSTIKTYKSASEYTVEAQYSDEAGHAVKIKATAEFTTNKLNIQEVDINIRENRDMVSNLSLVRLPQMTLQELSALQDILNCVMQCAEQEEI